MKLEADGIRLSYDHRRVLGDIYIKAETGKITGLLGRNGSGKSSLFKVIFGSLKTESKSVRIDNRPIRGITKRVRYLPQDCSFPGFLTLSASLGLFGVDSLHLRNWLEEFPDLHQRISELSLGQRRLFETLVMMYSDSDVVLLDEPFTGLSPIYVEILKGDLNRIKHHKGIMISDQQHEHVLEISDEVYLLRDGKTRSVSNLADLEELNYLRIKN